MAGVAGEGVAAPLFEGVALPAVQHVAAAPVRVRGEVNGKRHAWGAARRKHESEAHLAVHLPRIAAVLAEQPVDGIEQGALIRGGVPRPGIPTCLPNPGLHPLQKAHHRRHALRARKANEMRARSQGEHPPEAVLRFFFRGEIGRPRPRVRANRRPKWRSAHGPAQGGLATDRGRAPEVLRPLFRIALRRRRRVRILGILRAQLAEQHRAGEAQMALRGGRDRGRDRVGPELRHAPPHAGVEARQARPLAAQRAPARVARTHLQGSSAIAASARSHAKRVPGRQ
jgi:hypothetical protein